MTPEDPNDIPASTAAAALGRLGGRVRSAAKVKAARKNAAKARATKSAAKAKASAENGKKGGRPRKRVDPPTAEGTASNLLDT